jgi:hypothetical protein
MNAHEKTSAPRRGAEHYNQIDPSPNVRKSLDTTPSWRDPSFAPLAKSSAFSMEKKRELRTSSLDNYSV